MKNIFIVAALASAVLVAGFFMTQGKAQAQHDHHDETAEKQELVYTCTPDNFTLTQSGDSYILNASLETPTPGYSYEIIPVETRSGRIKAKLKLTAPEGVMITVIGNLDINHTFEYTGMLHALSIAVDKGFNWGPADVNCTHQ